MTKTRLTTEDALELVSHNRITANHVLVTYGRPTGDVRHLTGLKHNGLWAWRYADGVDDFLTTAQLEPMLRLGVAHVELETPSVFDAPEFEGWDFGMSDERGESRFTRTTPTNHSQLYSLGELWHGGVHVCTVPIADIPKAAAHINALLALGVQK